MEAKLTVKMEQLTPALPLVSIPKCLQFYLPPSLCKGSGKLMQDNQKEAMVIFLSQVSIEKFGEKMFRKAQVSLIEEVSNFAVGICHQRHPGGVSI